MIELNIDFTQWRLKIDEYIYIFNNYKKIQDKVKKAEHFKRASSLNTMLY